MSTRQAATTAWAGALQQAGLSDLSALLAPSFDPQRLDGRWTALVKPGLGGRQRWRWEPPHAAAPVYVKRYARTGWRAQLDRVLRQNARASRAAWEFEQAERLAESYVPVAPAVGFVEQMSGWYERRSAVLLAAAPGDGLDRVWQRCSAANAPITRGLARHELIVRLARFVSAFHHTGCCHRDLYLCHIFADVDPDAERPPEFCLIDLARTHRPRLRRMRWLLKDLAQLDFSARRCGATRVDRLRFLEAYLGLLRGSPRTRWYVRRIVARSDRILRRERRKGRL